MKYEGDFKDGKADGNGKIIYEDCKYYIGQLKNDHRHGKGILYYKNGNIKYEGDFVENKFGGNGNWFWKMDNIILVSLKMVLNMVKE